MRDDALLLGDLAHQKSTALWLDGAPIPQSLHPAVWCANCNDKGTVEVARLAGIEETMDLIETIQSRRAIREYTEAPVERSTVDDLIQAAVLAPSAMNRQPWAFAVCLNRVRVAQWSERATSWLLQNLPSSQLDNGAREILLSPGFTIFYNAPALIIVWAKSGEAQASEDCCLAAQNLMLAARAQGIGSCWIGFARPWLDLPATKKELGLPEDYHAVAPIILGRPSRWPEPHGRAPAEIHWLS